MRWTARIWAGLCLAFVGFFALAHLFNPEPSGPINPNDLAVLGLFPGGYLVGLALAFRWERLGGGLATLALVILFIWNSELLTSPTFPLLLAPPAVLFLLTGFLDPKKS